MAHRTTPAQRSKRCAIDAQHRFRVTNPGTRIRQHETARAIADLGLVKRSFD